MSLVKKVLAEKAIIQNDDVLATAKCLDYLCPKNYLDKDRVYYIKMKDSSDFLGWNNPDAFIQLKWIEIILASKPLKEIEG